MTKDLSVYSTEELLDYSSRTIDNPEIPAYDASWFLITERFRHGVDIDQLIGLMQSESSRQRSHAAYFLYEVPPLKELLTPVLKFAKDTLADCRWTFCYFIRLGGYYDDTIAKLLAEQLYDIDIRVRWGIFEWGKQAPEERFEHFARRVKADARNRRNPRFSNQLSSDFWCDAEISRALRGLAIMRRLRAKEDVEKLRLEFSGEDSHLWDHFLFWQTYLARREAWRAQRNRAKRQEH